MHYLATLFFGLFHWLWQTEPVATSMKNLNFLFAGYTIVWLLIIGYLFSLGRRQKKITQELETVKQLQREAVK